MPVRLLMLRAYLHRSGLYLTAQVNASTGHLIRTTSEGLCIKESCRQRNLQSARIKDQD
jgi:hypothetical protein